MSGRRLLPHTAVLSVALPFRRGEAAAPLPQRFKILNWGENIGRTTGARIVVDDHCAATLSANQELVACDRIPLDYEHQSVADHPNFVPDPRHVAGHGVIEVVPNDGIYLSALDYTTNGQAMAESYQDVSGVIHLDKQCRPMWISSVALTQRGDVAGMEFSESVAALSATRVPPISAFSFPLSAFPNTPMSETTPAAAPADEATFRALIIKLLKLKDDATDEDIIAGVSKEAAEPIEPEDGPTVALSARLDTIERNALVAQATREGKVIPLSADFIATTPVAVLSAMVAALPAGEVPLTLGAQKEVPAARTVALSADESRAAKSLGLTESEYLAAKA